MLGPRPEKEQSAKKKRKWEETGEASDNEEEGESVTNRDMEEWRERERGDATVDDQSGRTEATPAEHSAATSGASEATAPVPVTNTPESVPALAAPAEVSTATAAAEVPAATAPAEVSAAPIPAALHAATVPDVLPAATALAAVPAATAPAMLPAATVPAMLPAATAPAAVPAATAPTAVSASALATRPPPPMQTALAVPTPAAAPAPTTFARSGPGSGLRLGEGNDSGRSPDEIRIIKEMLAEDINKFIVDNRIDAPAGRDLRVEPVHVQLAVLDRGPLTSCMNPSGALIGRIRDAKKGSAPPHVHQSIQITPPFHQTQKTNPSAAPQSTKVSSIPGLVGPLAQMAGHVAGAAGGAGLGPEFERFVIEQRLDQGAVASLRSEAKEVMDKVIAMGPLINATNPSAALIGRIRNVRNGLQGRAQTHPTQTHPPQTNTPPPPPSSLSQTQALALAGVVAAPAAAVQDGVLNAEALKAIQALNFRSDGDMGMQQPNLQQPNLQDSQLQAEALKAIERINMSEL